MSTDLTADSQLETLSSEDASKYFEAVVKTNLGIEVDAFFAKLDSGELDSEDPKVVEILALIHLAQRQCQKKKES